MGFNSYSNTMTPFGTPQTKIFWAGFVGQPKPVAGDNGLWLAHPALLEEFQNKSMCQNMTHHLGVLVVNQALIPRAWSETTIYNLLLGDGSLNNKASVHLA